MKHKTNLLNEVFQHKVRLGMMSLLMVNDMVDFNTFKELLDITDGNLASNINTLEKHEYISIDKKLVGKKTYTTYQATELGKKAFKAHLDALEALIKDLKE